MLGVTRLIEWLNRVVPRSVVRGLQLALGLKLLTKGFAEIVGTGRLFAWDSVATATVCVVVVLALYFSSRVPGALVVFGIGLVALFAANPNLLAEIRFGFEWAWPNLADWDDWARGERTRRRPCREPRSRAEPHRQPPPPRCGLIEG